MFSRLTTRFGALCGGATLIFSSSVYFQQVEKGRIKNIAGYLRPSLSFADNEKDLGKPIATTAVAAAPYPVHLSGETTMQVSKEEAAKQSIDDDDEAWEKEKQNCSFCRHFLSSPCKAQFKNWSKCVDRAKAAEQDFVSACANETEVLMACTSDNQQYFSKAFEDNDDNSEFLERERHNGNADNTGVPH